MLNLQINRLFTTYLPLIDKLYVRSGITSSELFYWLAYRQLHLDKYQGEKGRCATFLMHRLMQPDKLDELVCFFAMTDVEKAVLDMVTSKVTTVLTDEDFRKAMEGHVKDDRESFNNEMFNTPE